MRDSINAWAAEVLRMAADQLAATSPRLVGVGVLLAIAVTAGAVAFF